MQAQAPLGGAGASARYYLPELDILRFFAFFLVFFNHVGQTDGAFWAQVPLVGSLGSLFIAAAIGSGFGVDLFFALSSFLITTLLMKEREKEGRIDVRAFYLRRALRIWPLYFVFLLLLRPLLPLVMPEENMPWEYTVAFLLFVGNWASVAWGFPHSAAAILWSVSMEEQFYLAWPWIVRKWGANLLKVSVVLIAVACVTRIGLVAGGAVHHQIWDNTFARLDPIACGMILAVIAHRKPFAFSAPARVALLLFGIAVLILIGRYGAAVGPKALVTLPAGSVACVALILATLGLRMPSAATNPVLKTPSKRLPEPPRQ